MFYYMLIRDEFLSGKMLLYDTKHNACPFLK